MEDRILWSQVEKRRCAQCHGKMVMRHRKNEETGDTEWYIICPRGCEPGGHVSEKFVEASEAQDSIDAFKVKQNYPELDPHKLTEEEVERGKNALWE